jgi:hypothetical protein
VREGAADRGEGFGSSGMQCEVVAVRIAIERDMMIVGRRIDRRSMYEDRGVRRGSQL